MMWSAARSLLVVSLIASTACAKLSFTATVEQDGQEVEASDLVFVPIPPLTHGRSPSSGLSPGQERRGKDPVSYSSNWCGASQHSTGSDEVSNIFSFFTAPDLTLRPQIPAPQFAAAWVGIDGAECKTALLQAGVTTIVNSNGGQSASAWWEWYPEAAYTIDGLRVKPGDWMSVNITATDSSSATVVITNAQRGYSVNIVISNGPKLCRVDAEWIVEDFYDAGKQVAFANFSEMWFVDAAATTARGKNIGIDGATMVSLRTDDGTVLCSAERYDNANFVVSSHGPG